MYAYVRGQKIAPFKFQSTKLKTKIYFYIFQCLMKFFEVLRICERLGFHECPPSSL